MDIESRTRTHLANERTFLAWLRTGVTLIALGLAAAQLLTGDGSAGIPIVRLVATLLVVAGTATVAIGGVRYARGRTRIEQGAFMPAGRSVIVSAAIAILIGALGIGFIWMTNPR